jgi:hypothetical protein
LELVLLLLPWRWPMVVISLSYRRHVPKRVINALWPYLAHGPKRAHFAAHGASLCS